MVKAEIEESRVLAANEAFYASFNRKDIEAMDRAWSNRPDLTCLHPGWNLLHGREEVVDSWRSILSNPNQPRIVVGGAEVIMLGSVAIVICRELVSGSPLAATNVYLFEDGGWKLVHHQSGPVSSLT